MYRVVHISDLHYETSSREKIRSLLDRVSTHNPDHLIISGDLTEDGRPVHARGLGDLLAKHGFNTSDKLTVLPGNHDLYGYIYQTFSHAHSILEEIEGLRSLKWTVERLWQLRKRMAEYGEREYGEELDIFRANYDYAFRGTLTARGHRGGFPFVKLLPNNLALIGVDSCFYLPKPYSLWNLLRQSRTVIRTHDISLLGENLSGSAGWVDLDALDAIMCMPEVSRRRKVLVLHHCLHPMSYLRSTHTEVQAQEMQLVNRTRLVDRLCAYGIEIVLHGHYHKMLGYRLENGLRVLNSGGVEEEEFFSIELTDADFEVQLVKDSSAGFPTLQEPISF